MCKCLFCYKNLDGKERDFHSACARRFFGIKEVPIFDYTRSDMNRLALEIIQSQTALTGVQPKLSLHLTDYEGSKRLTVVGMWGDYVFKPQTESFSFLPEIEDLTMHLAEDARIETVPHTLIRLKNGELGYITCRIDRVKSKKLHMEDLCQLSGRQTEDKYHSSYEKVSKVIRTFSTVPDMDNARLWEVVLFSWLTGNNDMHLKNFSLYQPESTMRILTPAYDLLNVVIVNPKDTEELALTLNGKRSRIRREDFEKAMLDCGMYPKVVENIFNKYRIILPKWEKTIRQSFLSVELQETYLTLLQERMNRLYTNL